MAEDPIIMIGSDVAPSEPPAAPAPAASPPEAEAPLVESAPTPVPAPPVESPVPGSVQARIDQMTRQRREAERERDFWRARALASERPAPAPPGEPGAPAGGAEPREEDFDTQAAFVAALHRFHAKAALDAERTAQHEAALAQTLAQTQAALHATIQAREAEVLATTPDYYERCEAVVRQVTPAVKWALEHAGAHGPDLVLYLHDHPEAVTRLNQTAPHALGVELGLLRSPTNGSAPPSAAPSPAPPKPEPPTAVTGGRTTTPGFREDMSQREWEEQWKRTFNRR